MNVVLAVFHLHLAESRSLKEKRSVISRLKSRIKSRFNVAVAEVEHQDTWQRSDLAVVSVASAREPLERLVEEITEEVERELPGELLGVETEQLV